MFAALEWNCRRNTHRGAGTTSNHAQKLPVASSRRRQLFGSGATFLLRTESKFLVYPLPPVPPRYEAQVLEGAH